MGLETATYVEDLVTTNPVAGDYLSYADNHLRLLKTVLQASFPGTDAPRYFEQAREDVADSATPALWASTSNYVNLLGATTITGFASGTDGQQRLVRIAAARTLTHHATTLDLPGGANITAAAGDHMLVHCGGTTANTVVAYWRRSGVGFAAGTRMLFAQASAPVGWTKVTSYNDYAVRLVSGTGAGTGGSTAFSSVLTARTIANSNLPVSSPWSIQDPTHRHGYIAPESTINVTGTGGYTVPQYANPANSDYAATGITLGSNSGGGQSMDFAVQYLDVILCEAD